MRERERESFSLSECISLERKNVDEKESKGNRRKQRGRLKEEAKRQAVSEKLSVASDI